MTTSFKTVRDVEKAENLNWRGRTFCIMGGEIAISNAKKMAKLIKDPKKILGRLEAIAERWSDSDIIIPFVERVIQLHPNSKYETAYHDGFNTGRYCMSPVSNPGGDEAEMIMWNIGFEKGRG